MVIRDAVPADAPQLVPLLDALGYPADPATIRQCRDWLRAVDPTSRVPVAQVGDAAEAHFRALGATRPEVTSGSAHVPAYDFYRRLGSEDQGVRFAKSLEPSGGTA